MNKKQFLTAIQKEISGLPKNDIERFLDYYAEMIDDRMEEGLSEEQAVKAMGTVDEIVEQILADASFQNVKKTEKRSLPKLSALEIVLLLLGSPVWIPLLLAAVIVLLAVYIVIWSVVLVLYATDVTLAAGGIAGVFGSVVLVMTGNLMQALFFFGTGLVCAGFTILWFFVCNAVAKGIIKVSGFIIKWIGFWFHGKEESV